MGKLPAAPFERILRNAGAQRVSMKAAVAFAQIMADVSDEIAKEAVRLSKHAKRKTLKAEDIKLAKKF